jgi:replicative DNA helicase
MQFPHYDDVAELASELGIAGEHLPLLERVSRRAVERTVLRETSPSRCLAPLGPVDEQEFQAAEAIWFHAGYVPPVFEWPWRGVQALAGAVLPGEVWVVAGQSGNGKSQWVANLIARLAKRGQPFLTVAPLERKPRELRGLWACLDLGYEPALAFKGQWHLLPAGAREQLLAHMREQACPPLRERIVFAPDATLDRAALKRLAREKHEWHHRLLIIDHLHHMDHGDGPDTRGIRDTMRLAKRLAQELDLAIIFTAQLNRGHKADAYQRFYPPEMTDLQGSSAIEQVADGVLLLYRPLVEGVKRADIDAVRMGQAERDSVFRPNTMAVRCGKHRLDGSKLGKDAFLHIRAGVIRGLAVLPGGTPVADPDEYEPDLFVPGDAWEGDAGA